MWQKIRKAMRYVIAVLLGALVVIQFIPVDRSNPPITMDVIAPAAVKSILRQSCYDCHSNEVKWAWYSDVAPLSWLIAKDVREGREHLNFSTWDRYTVGERSKFAAESYEESVEGEMPLSIYLIMHNDARLTDEELRVLRMWADPTAHASDTRLGGSTEHDDDD